jgi:hypothetical protein
MGMLLAMMRAKQLENTVEEETAPVKAEMPQEAPPAPKAEEEPVAKRKPVRPAKKPTRRAPARKTTRK